MIVYSGTKNEFIDDVKFNIVVDKIIEKMKEYHIPFSEGEEESSWPNSLNFMKNILDDNDIPNANVSIEYQIPRTSKRVDFIISGRGNNNEENVVIIELKQWAKANKVDELMSHSVRTFTGHAERIVAHPSYQAYSYAVAINSYSALVQDEHINLIPCAYLHNYNPDYVEALNDPIYKEWTNYAPFYIKSQFVDFQEFIKKYIAKTSADNELLFKIDHGRIRPSKALQDCLTSVLNGNKEFMLIDDQAVAFDTCLKAMDECRKDGHKRVLVIQGGAGTGKSVLAINLLHELLCKSYNVAYCTKNSAPRNSYLKLLSKNKPNIEVKIDTLFRSPFHLCEIPHNFYDCLIVDEAHRLVKQMYGDFHGVNQVKECIESALLSVFLIDENQSVTTKDIGSIDEIKKWSNELNAELTMGEDLILKSQFRCNGSDAYIQVLNNILQISEYTDIKLNELNFDFRVFDDPSKMREELRKINEKNNKARMVAGYCFDWNVKYHRGDWDVVLDGGNFKAKWNLNEDKYWAINPESFDEIGCFHTAQGMEFDYVGVIIGNDLRYDKDNNKIIADQKFVSKDDKTSGIRTCGLILANKLIKNTYKTLLTRGQKGCFVYCEDKALAEYIKSFLK